MFNNCVYDAGKLKGKIPQRFLPFDDSSRQTVLKSPLQKEAAESADIFCGRSVELDVVQAYCSDRKWSCYGGGKITRRVEFLVQGKKCKSNIDPYVILFWLFLSFFGSFDFPPKQPIFTSPESITQYPLNKYKTPTQLPKHNHKNKFVMTKDRWEACMD